MPPHRGGLGPASRTPHVEPETSDSNRLIVTRGIATAALLRRVALAQTLLSFVGMFVSFSYISNLMTLFSGYTTLRLIFHPQRAMAFKSENITIRGLNIMVLVFAALEAMAASLVSHQGTI